MSRRRMMMQQLGKGFELVYDSSSGVVPDNTVWRRFANPYNNQFGVGTQKIVDNVLVLHNGHGYEKQGYYPIGHEYADNCELSVIFISTDDQITIHLTDGVLSAMGTVGDSTFRVRPMDVTSNIVIYQQAIEFKDINTFKVIKKGSTANYYFNDELLFTQTDLFSIDHIITDTAGSSSTPGLVTEQINGWGYGCGGTDSYILGFTYKEV